MKFIEKKKRKRKKGKQTKKETENTKIERDLNLKKMH